MGEKLSVRLEWCLSSAEFWKHQVTSEIHILAIPKAQPSEHSPRAVTTSFASAHTTSRNLERDLNQHYTTFLPQLFRNFLQFSELVKQLRQHNFAAVLLMVTRDNCNFIQQGFCNWFWHEISSLNSDRSRAPLPWASWQYWLGNQDNFQIRTPLQRIISFLTLMLKWRGGTQRFHCFCFLTETKCHGKSWHNATVMDWWMEWVFHCSDWAPRPRQLQLWGISTSPSTPAFIPGRLSWHILIL